MIFQVWKNVLKEIFEENKAFGRSSHQGCSVRRGVLRNFSKLTRKHHCQSLFFNKVAVLLLMYFISAMIFMYFVFSFPYKRANVAVKSRIKAITYKLRKSYTTSENYNNIMLTPKLSSILLNR